MLRKHLSLFLIITCLPMAALLVTNQARARHLELPNAIQLEAPYNTAEASVFPPPWETLWENANNPGKCSRCHSSIFNQWNGSMMSNAWRDPAWRSAFFLLSRATATDGNCDTPNPPDGTERALLNPYANGDCTSTFNLGDQLYTTSGSGSLLDDFCSDCHMPTNFVDNVAPDGSVNPLFDPTSAADTSLAFATVDAHFANTETGKRGIFCKVCHSLTGTRNTAYHNYVKSGTDYVPAVGDAPRDSLVAPADQDMLDVADPTSPNLGYAIGSASFKFSPHAIERRERFGPLTFNDYSAMTDPYLSEVFTLPLTYELGDSSRHDLYYTAFIERTEWCGTCHDVTNPLQLKNPLGRWTGSFPLERTYTEHRNSRYADRPDNPSYDPAFKRDCQTCHMQQSYGRPGTAQTIYDLPPLTDSTCDWCDEVQVFHSHLYIGGNTYFSHMLGADVNSSGDVHPYPELSNYSFSSADHDSIYHHAYWENVGAKGPATQHARLAWDRLLNALEVTVSGPAAAVAGTTQPITISVANTGVGHNFPSGFPEGRNAWVAVRAWDVATGDQLEIFDSHWTRTSQGVGYLTTAAMADPNFPGCDWVHPAGAPDPYAYQFRAVATLGDGCPTLAVTYATPLNLVTNADGLPIDADGTVIDGANPEGLPQFTDLDGDGEVSDDSFLIDTRLRPMPHADATLILDRYAVVIPTGTVGPVAVTTEVYYQSMEAIVAVEILGNLADTDEDMLLEPCTLGGICDGRTPMSEPAVVEGVPPVPVEVANWVINVDSDITPPTRFFAYPQNGAIDVYSDVVAKIGLCEPVIGIDETSFTLVDGDGLIVPAFVEQISDGVWGLFPHDVFLDDDTYTAHVSAPICDVNGNCSLTDEMWSFTVNTSTGTGNTTNPVGFGMGCGGGGIDQAPSVAAVEPADQATGVPRDTNLVVTFSEPITGFDATAGFTLHEAGDDGRSCDTLGALIDGISTPNATGDIWTFNPDDTLGARRLHCVNVGAGVMDTALQPLTPTFSSSFQTGRR